MEVGHYTGKCQGLGRYFGLSTTNPGVAGRRGRGVNQISVRIKTPMNYWHGLLAHTEVGDENLLGEQICAKNPSLSPVEIAQLQAKARQTCHPTDLSVIILCGGIPGQQHG